MPLPRLLHRIGLVACLLLIVACFMPWTFYPDIKQTFTGFYSYQNQYGKPGKFFVLLAVIAFVLMYLPRIWAKRTNLFVCALALGYAIKTFVLFTSCYNTFCPQKQPGIYLVMFSTFLMLLSSVFPDLKVPPRPKEA